MAEWVDALRMLHVVLVSMWMGGALFAVFMIAPSVQAAGASGKAFMMTVLRRGGYGQYFGLLAVLSVLSGLALFGARRYDRVAFDGAANSILTIGAILGVLALAEGLAVNMPAERKMKALVAQVGPQGPTPEQGAKLEQLALKVRKASVRGAAMIVTAFLLMMGRTLLI